MNVRKQQQANKQPLAEVKAQADDHPQLVARARLIDDRWVRVQLDGAPWPVLH